MREKQAFIAKAIENDLWSVGEICAPAPTVSGLRISRSPPSFVNLAISIAWIFHTRSAQTTQ